jgi:hypothetical protein
MSRLVPLIITCVASAAVAYPIPAQTVWGLTRSAELIVIATVEEVKVPPDVEEPSGEAFGRPHVASLRVTEVLKGAVEPVLEVDYPGNLLCPAPPRFVVGETVVAFLIRDRSRWAVGALSYGTRYPGSARGVADMRDLIGLALTTQPAKAGNPPLVWVLEAIARPATRWDGVYELRHEADDGHSAYDVRPASAPLSTTTLSAVEAAFLSAPTADETLPLMLELLEDHRSTAVTMLVVDLVDAALRTEVPWWAARVLTQLERRVGLGARVVKERSDARRDPLVESAARMAPTQEALRARWDDLKRRAQLIPRPREVPPARRTATGGTTPL